MLSVLHRFTKKQELKPDFRVPTSLQSKYFESLKVMQGQRRVRCLKFWLNKEISNASAPWTEMIAPLSISDVKIKVNYAILVDFIEF